MTASSNDLAQTGLNAFYTGNPMDGAMADSTESLALSFFMGILDTSFNR